MNSNWPRAFAEVMKSEGGFTDDSRDKGNRLPDGRPGCTNLGVTQRAWEKYVGRQVTHDEMKALNLSMVQPFYKINYWDAVKGDQLPLGVDYLCFDLAVNAGPGRAVMTLQGSLGISSDGSIGPMTLAAVKSADPGYLIDNFTDAKVRFYKSLNNPTFEQGWINRAHHSQEVAHSMLLG